ncbi:Pre-mRNA-splicing factor CWC21 [Golovinomyces cichoracearum]|uniref:Pre-mRNA-splicing factor CWC21 n=1 Tax=Golovinomyces cichoracearum TaxID=62708 RepID=A0A420IB38_9PEZI|nr:Pre-mRNA-splicing factor CWC21 [Golovinomyces cichoracearum]
MSSNVGLCTPRGSGTSGYVQRNLAYIKPRDRSKPYSVDIDSRKHRQRQPDKDILDHARKREIEVKVFELRDKLEEEGIDEEAIETQTEALRRKLVKENKNPADISDSKNIKIHDVHGLAEAKIKQEHRLRNALGIRSNYEEGDHWKKQEEKEKLIAERHGNGEKHR